MTMRGKVSVNREEKRQDKERKLGRKRRSIDSNSHKYKEFSLLDAQGFESLEGVPLSLLTEQKRHKKEKRKNKTEPRTII